MKSRDLGSNRFNTIRTDENQLELINEFYKLTNFFIKEGMFLKYPTYESLRTIVYEFDSIIKKDNVLYECTRKEAIRRIEITQIKRERSPFISMIEEFTHEDVLTFNNIINYHKQ